MIKSNAYKEMDIGNSIIHLPILPLLNYERRFKMIGNFIDKNYINVFFSRPIIRTIKIESSYRPIMGIDKKIIDARSGGVINAATAARIKYAYRRFAPSVR